jgi:hypothetical protein
MNQHSASDDQSMHRGGRFCGVARFNQGKSDLDDHLVGGLVLYVGHSFMQRHPEIDAAAGFPIYVAVAATPVFRRHGHKYETHS